MTSILIYWFMAIGLFLSLPFHTTWDFPTYNAVFSTFQTTIRKKNQAAYMMLYGQTAFPAQKIWFFEMNAFRGGIHGRPDMAESV